MFLSWIQYIDNHLTCISDNHFTSIRCELDTFDNFWLNGINLVLQIRRIQNDHFLTKFLSNYLIHLSKYD